MLAGLFPKPDVKALIRRVPERKAAATAHAPGQTAFITDAMACAGGETVSNAALEAHSADTAPHISGGVGSDEARAAGRPFDGMDDGDRGPAGTAGSLAALGDRPSPLMRVAPEPARHPLAEALSADRYLVRFTARGETCAKLRRAQELLRHAVPDGDPAEVVDRALTALLAQLEKRKFAATVRPRARRETGSGAEPGAESGSGSRSIPADVRRAVTARDEGQCAFRGGTRRCGERGFLEFHHVVPYARGGPATVENIQLRCRAHNAYEAGLDFGGWRREQERPTRPGTSWGVGREEGRAGRSQSGPREP